MERRNVIRTVRAFGLAVICLPAVAASAQTQPQTQPQTQAAQPTFQERLDRLVDRLETQRRELHVPGMAIAIVKDDEVVLARGFGVMDVRTQTPVTEQTLFAIGSTTKAFTSALIGMLVDDGLMSWDDAVTSYLPYYELKIDSPDETVTIRDLLCHRSGFTRMSLLWAANLVDRETLLRTATGAEPWAGFRERFLYNNVMYLAAGMAAGRAARTDWDTLLAERIFKPLGMTSSNTSVTASLEDPRLATGYLWDDEKQIHEHQPMRVLDAIGPAGAINSNVVDMARWVRFQLGRGAFEGRRLISAEALAETWTGQIEITPGRDYGLGWMLAELDGRRLVEHGGAIDGFSAEVALLPEENLGFVMLTNVSATPLASAAPALVFDALVGEWTDETDGTPLPDGIDPYLGRYLANFGPFADTEFTVLEQGGHLAVDVPGQQVYALKPPDEDGKWWFALPVGIAVSFNRDEDDRVISMMMYQAGYEFEMPRVGVELPAEIPLDELQKFLGSYRFEKIGGNATVLISNNRLAVDVPGQMVYELYPPDDDGRWPFRVKKQEIQVRFNANDDGAIESMTMYEAGMEFELPRLADDPGLALPTIDELMAKVRAGYGAESLTSTTTTRMTGTLNFAHQGVQGTFTALTAGTDRFRTHLDLGTFGFITIAVDGARGWTDSAFHPFEELSGTHLETVKLDHPLKMLSDWREIYDTVVILRADEVRGEPVYVVKLTRGDTPPRTVYVSTETGRILRVDAAEIAKGIGSIPITIFYDDYRQVEGGLWLPFEVKTENEFSGRLVVRIDRIETNVELSEDAFVLKKRRSDVATERRRD